MLQPFIASLQPKRIILGSTSPRRKEILARLNLIFEVIAAPLDEAEVQSELRKLNTAPVDYCRKLAHRKAESIVNLLTKSVDEQSQSTSGKQPDLVICADTVVEYDGKIFEKPKDEANAVQILNTLSGKTHQVHTGVCLAINVSSLLGVNELKNDYLPSWCERSVTSAEASLAATPTVAASYSFITFHETTAVRMANYSESVARAYVATREPLDKAGAYGIQGIGGSLIEAIEGDYYNVVGFPLHRFAHTLAYFLQHAFDTK